jgi:uncharacterized protein YecT (DUF1311 family)
VKLNAAYKSTMMRLPQERQAALRVEQRTWVARRDGGCQADEERAGMGGTAATLNIIGCQAARTVESTVNIETFR